MKGTIKVTGVREVVGFIHQNSIYAENPNRYNSCKLTTRKYEPKALYVEAEPIIEFLESLGFNCEEIK